MGRRKQTNATDKKKKELIKKVTEAQENLYNLYSYTDTVYADFLKEIAYQGEDFIKNKTDSKYAKLRELLDSVFGESSLSNLDFLENRGAITMFLKDVVAYDRFQKDLVSGIRASAQQVSLTNNRQGLARNLLMKYFLENAIEFEEKLNGAKTNVPEKYERELYLLNGDYIKDIFIESRINKLQREMKKLTGDNIRIEAKCEDLTDDWIKENLELNLRELYLDSEFVYKTFCQGEDLDTFLCRPFRENYLNLSRIGKVVNYFNVSRDDLGTKLIQLDKNINDKTEDWFKKQRYDVRELYHMTKNLPPTIKRFSDIFSDEEELERFLANTVKDNYDYTEEFVKKIAYEKLGVCNLIIDQWSEKATNAWVKENLFVDLRKLDSFKKIYGLKDMFASYEELNKFLNRTVKENLEYMIDKEYGTTLASYCNKEFENMIKTVEAEMDFIKNMKNLNLKFASAMYFTNVFNIIRPHLQFFFYSILMNNSTLFFDTYDERHAADREFARLMYIKKHLILETGEFDYVEFDAFSYKQLELMKSLIEESEDIDWDKLTLAELNELAERVISPSNNN